MTPGDQEKLCAEGPNSSGVRTKTPTDPLYTVCRARSP